MKNQQSANPQPPAYLLGVDVSVYNGKMNWEQCFLAGARVAMLRAAVGPAYTDPSFERNYNDARAAGMLVTAYVVPLPSSRTGRERYSAEEQVKHFRDVLDGREIDLPVVIDAEIDNGWGRGDLTALFEDVARGLHNLGGFPHPGIYTRKTWWDVHIRRSPGWSRYPLHVAHYTSAPRPWLPSDWYDWEAWQFTNKAPAALFGGEGRAMDLNYVKQRAQIDPAALPDEIPCEVTIALNGSRYTATLPLRHVQD